MDVHVPGPITWGLRLRGVEVLTCQDDKTTRWADENLLVRAAELRRVMVSFDEDFKRVVASFLATGHEFSGYVHIPHARLMVGECVTKLTALARIFDSDDVWNTVIHLAEW